MVLLNYNFIKCLAIHPLLCWTTPSSSALLIMVPLCTSSWSSNLENQHQLLQLQATSSIAEWFVSTIYSYLSVEYNGLQFSLSDDSLHIPWLVKVVQVLNSSIVNLIFGLLPSSVVIACCWFQNLGGRKSIWWFLDFLFLFIIVEFWLLTLQLGFLWRWATEVRKRKWM